MKNPFIILAVLAIAVIALLYWFFGTERGCSLRATGANANMARAQGINTDADKVLGLMLSNGLVAFAGALLTQYQGFVDVGMGRGAIVIGLAAVIIGTNIFKNRQKVNSSTAAIAGSLIYKACVALALSLGLVPLDLKLVTAALFLIILVLGGIRRKKVKFDA